MKQSTKDYRISAKEIIMWVHRHVPQRQLILIVAFLIGLCASFAGLVLHWLIEQIQHVLPQDLQPNLITCYILYSQLWVSSLHPYSLNM